MRLEFPLKTEENTTTVRLGPKIARWIVELHDEMRKDELVNLMLRYNETTDWIDHNHLYAWGNVS